MAVPPLSTDALVVFGLVAAALVLFVTEWLSPDMTAIGVLVSLAVLEPITGVPWRDALLGFASPAVVTIMAMYILSAGIEETGVVDRLGGVLADVTRGDETKLLAAITATTGTTAGLINNTPVVAVFIPLVTDLSERYHISPSKFLLPLSYAAMLGGTLTLIGTATNLLASDLSRTLLNHPLSMFEMTPVGLVVFAVGIAYLMTVGRWLVPERIEPTADFTEEFDMNRYLAVLEVREDSPLVGHTVSHVLDGRDPDLLQQFGFGEDIDENGDLSLSALEAWRLDVDVLQMDRNGESFFASGTDRPLEAGDRLTVRANPQAVNQFAERYDLRQYPRESVTEDLLAQSGHPGTLFEAVIHGDSRLAGRTLADARLRQRFDTTVLAVKRGDELIREGLAGVELSTGDTLLLQTTPDDVAHLQTDGFIVVTETPVEAYGPDLPSSLRGEPPSLQSNTPLAVGILLGVILLAALDVVPIAIAALGGVVLLVATDVLPASRAYDAVSWNVIFLLAGLLPLGVAMRHTGGAEFIAALVAETGTFLPPLAVLVLFYLLAAITASVITPAATVVLMIPIAVDTAGQLGVAGFPFLLVVAFAAANAFITPIGYQTNLMVYGPGGYRFTDYLRVGVPLQLLLTVVTPLSIVALWPLTPA